ncbi:MAG TPA: pyrimidine dimer DNA glycosylase/endonuclease V [Burkholderiales bacterium]
MALWREALLARHVLGGRTVGYRHHPQLLRFRACGAPRAAIDVYLGAVHAEAVARGYEFDRSKFRRNACSRIAVTEGQLEHEWKWLMAKLRKRNPQLYRLHRRVSAPEIHPLFRLRPGPIAAWERP